VLNHGLGVALLATLVSLGLGCEVAPPSERSPSLPPDPVFIASSEAVPSASAVSTAQTLTLLTYNVLASEVFVTARMKAVCTILRKADADIVALQEVAPFVTEALTAGDCFANYPFANPEHRRASPDGQLIVSKLPIARSAVQLLTSAQHRTVLIAEIPHGSRGLMVATTHMDSPLGSQAIRAQQLKEIVRLMEAADDAVLMGDLNFGDGEQPTTSAIPASYQDVWLVLHAGDPGYTWNNDKNPLAAIGAFVGEPNRRLDRILVRSSVWRASSVRLIGDAPAAQEVLTRRDRARIEMPDRDSETWSEPMIEVFPSDHFGLLATFETGT
jgi:poly(A) polymerase